MSVALQQTLDQTNVIGIDLNNIWYFRDSSKLSYLRSSERNEYYSNSGPISTYMIFDEKSSSVSNSLYSIYTTLFVIFLLLVSCYYFLSEFLCCKHQCCFFYANYCGMMMILMMMYIYIYIIVISVSSCNRVEHISSPMMSIAL